MLLHKGNSGVMSFSITPLLHTATTSLSSQKHVQKNTSSAVCSCMGKVLWDLLVRFFVSVSMQYIATQILFTFQGFSAVLHRRRKHLLFHPESCCVFI